MLVVLCQGPMYVPLYVMFAVKEVVILSSSFPFLILQPNTTALHYPFFLSR